jgi:hypothetical protein
MKKNTLAVALLSLACLAPMASACKKTDAVTQVALTFGQKYDESLSDEAHFHSLHYSDLTALISSADNNFILVSVPKDPSCLCWSGFLSTINRYQKNKNALIYSIPVAEFDSKDYLGLELNSGEGTIAIFENGKVKYQVTANGESDAFATDYATFAEWMGNRVLLSDMLYVTKSQMEALYAGKLPFTLGFLRASCGDCNYVAAHFLHEYNQIQHNENYVIDCDVEGIRFYNGTAPNQQAETTSDAYKAFLQWDEFKANYGLSTVHDPTFGYSGGVVPTWVRANPAGNDTAYPAGAIEDMDVWVNDEVEMQTDGNYKVTQTFFDGTRPLPFLEDESALKRGGATITNLLGLAVPVADVDVTHSYWKHEAAAKYHDPLLKSFFEEYIAMKA